MKTSTQTETLGSGLSSRGSASVSDGAGPAQSRRSVRTLQRLAGQEIVGRHPALHRRNRPRPGPQGARQAQTPSFLTPLRRPYTASANARIGRPEPDLSLPSCTLVSTAS